MFLIAEIIFKPREFLQKCEFDRSRRTVALFGNQNLRHTRIFVRRFVIFLTINKRHYIRVLLDAARFSQIRHHAADFALRAHGKAVTERAE